MGSNIINFLILAILDLVIINNRIYDFYNKNSISLAYLGLYATIILMYPLLRNKSLGKATYIIPSLVIMTIIFFLLVYTI